MEVNTKVKAGFSNKLFALNVVITIPVPDTTASADMQTSIGAHGPMHCLSNCSPLSWQGATVLQKPGCMVKASQTVSGELRWQFLALASTNACRCVVLARHAPVLLPPGMSWVWQGWFVPWSGGHAC